jgi:hypothetical protein
LENELQALSHETQDFKELQSAIAKVQSDDYRTRAIVASKLKSLVHKILIAPVGSTPLMNQKHDHTIVVGGGKKNYKASWFALNLICDKSHAKVYGTPGTVVMLDDPASK